MKKKLLICLCTFALALGLVSCGSDSEETYGGYTSDVYDNLTKTYMSYLMMYEDDSDTLSQIASSFPAFDELYESYEECKEEDLGEFIAFGSTTVEKSGKTITATLVSDYSKRDMKITFVFSALDVESGPTSINAEPVYTLGETMKKAGLNTIMGILIVFCMLVLMSGVIKCFEIIPKIEASLKNDNNNQVPTATHPVEPVQKDAAADDLELVAVIAAAIAASTGASTDSFVVRSIKKRR